MSFADLFADLGRRSKESSANLLRRGQGVEGPLKPKSREDGRPLGGDLPRVIRAGRVDVLEDGWNEVYDSEELEVFHTGRLGQPARPVIGLTREERRDVAKAVTQELLREFPSLEVNG